MVSLCLGVCKASRWCHRATVPAHRHACARNTVTLQLQGGGYALLWKRYNNSNMAAIRYYGNDMTSKNGGYALLWKRYDNNKTKNMAATRYYGNVMTDVFYIFNSTVVDWTCFFFPSNRLWIALHGLQNFAKTETYKSGAERVTCGSHSQADQQR